MEEYTKIRISAFIKKYRSVMHEDLFMQLVNYELAGNKVVELTTHTIVALDESLKQKKEQDRLLSKCAQRNNRGSELEKAGEIRKAIKVYESNIQEGCYPAFHSFNRLMVLYRKLKDYDNEIRVIKRALEVFQYSSNNNDEVNQLIKRLEKAELLLDKSKS